MEHTRFVAWRRAMLGILLGSCLLYAWGCGRKMGPTVQVQGKVTLDGSPAKASTEGRRGQVAIIEVPEPRPSGIVPLHRALTVLYEDEACIAVDKPSGLVTHPAKGHWDDTLVNALSA